MSLQKSYFKFTTPAFYEIIKTMPDSIFNQLYIKDFKQNEILLKKHQKIDYAYLLFQGTTQVISEFSDGQIYKFTRNTAPTFIGTHALMAEHRYASVTVKADTYIKSLVFPVDLFYEWIKSDVNACYWVAKEIAINMYPVSANYGRHLFSSTITIFLDVLLQEYRRAGAGDRTRIRKTREELSYLSGVSIRSINRHIQLLKDQGLIEIAYGKIEITREQFIRLKQFIKDEINQIEMHS